MEKVFEYAIKHLEKSIKFNASYAKKSRPGGTLYEGHTNRVKELEVELERVKALQQDCLKSKEIDVIHETKTTIESKEWENDIYTLKVRMVGKTLVTTVHKKDKEFGGKVRIKSTSKTFENLPKYIKDKIEEMENMF